MDQAHHTIMLRGSMYKVCFGILIGILWSLGMGQVVWAKSSALQMEQLIQKAGVIFEGTCLSKISKKDPLTGLPATFYTFQVESSFKGKVGEIYSLKTFGSNEHDLKVADLPTFQVGEDLLLFVYPPSEWGFASTVGFHSGVFEVHKTPQGKLIVSRVYSQNTTVQKIQRSLGESQIQPGSIPYNQFVGMIRNHLQKEVK